MIHPFYSIHFVILIITILMDETKSSLSWSQKSPRSISVEHYNVNYYFIPISLWQSIWKRQRNLSYRFRSQLNIFDQFPWRFRTLENLNFYCFCSKINCVWYWPQEVAGSWRPTRHDICQKHYATGEQKITKNCVNRDKSKFTTKERKHILRKSSIKNTQYV